MVVSSLHEGARAAALAGAPYPSSHLEEEEAVVVVGPRGGGALRLAAHGPLEVAQGKVRPSAAEAYPEEEAVASRRRIGVFPGPPSRP